MQKARAKKTVFVGMSGGVDSSVAVLLLKKKGYDAVGVFMRCWSQGSSDALGIGEPCGSERDAEDARRVAEHIGIPFYVWDFEEEYKKKVVGYMVEGYKKGITPNPDVECNREVKFGLFLARALRMGADYVATGHYVRLRRSSFPGTGVASAPAASAHLHLSAKTPQDGDQAFGASDSFPERNSGFGPNERKFILSRNPAAGELGVPHPAGLAVARTSGGRRRSGRSGLRKEYFSLFTAEDKNKDQSYFLWTLGQDELAHCLFPIGDYVKPKVREMARKAGLPTAEKKDSQGICFLGKITISDFLKAYIPEKKGLVLSTTGKELGEHKGAQFYTIGQRHGIGNLKHNKGNAAHKPVYVAEKDVRTNTVVVAEGEDNEALFKKEVKLSGVHFISGFAAPKKMEVYARVRYRQPVAKATLEVGKKNSAILRFDKPQKFVAPGQSAVFYVGDPSVGSGRRRGRLRMLGGGIIKLNR